MTPPTPKEPEALVRMRYRVNTWDVYINNPERAEILAYIDALKAERDAAVRKLLEAKDCAVRAELYADPYTMPVETTVGTAPSKALLEECVRRGLIVLNNR
jgi:hypothetical protein